MPVLGICERGVTMGPIICFTMAAINIPFIVNNPSSWFNWASAVFCFGLGIACAVQRQ